MEQADVQPPSTVVSTPAKKKRKTWLWILLSVLGVLGILIGLFVWWVLGGSTGNPTKNAQVFFAATKAGQTDQAYDATAQVFKDSTTREAFDAFLEAYPILTEFGEVKFSGVERQSGEGKTISVLSGTLIATDASENAMEVTMISENGEWKVATVDLQPTE